MTSPLRFLKDNSGQALTSMLIIMFFGLTVTAAATAIVGINSLSTSGVEESNEALTVAESGVENSLLRELRDPSYLGETLTLGNGTATITVTPGSPTTIVSQGTVGNHRRTIRVIVNFSSGVMVINSWKEI